jgi:hypothetical protein
MMVSMAASPEEKAKPAWAPSMPARSFSSGVRVGLPLRLYS